MVSLYVWLTSFITSWYFINSWYHYVSCLVQYVFWFFFSLNGVWYNENMQVDMFVIKSFWYCTSFNFFAFCLSWNFLRFYSSRFNCMFLSCHVCSLEWIHTLQLSECQGTPCSKQVRNLKVKWLQLDSNPEPLSS